MARKIKDAYAEKFANIILRAVKREQTGREQVAELATIIDKIYCDGFSDGIDYVQDKMDKEGTDEKFLSDIRQVIDYTLENEEKHWEENDKPSAHIYCNAQRVDKALKKIGIN